MGLGNAHVVLASVKPTDHQRLCCPRPKPDVDLSNRHPAFRYFPALKSVRVAEEGDYVIFC